VLRGERDGGKVIFKITVKTEDDTQDIMYTLTIDFIKIVL